MKFEWHEIKASVNLKKHDVAFEEAVSCFYDPDHSKEEDRELMIAHSNKGRLLIIAYLIRDESIRLISARCATTQESKWYEKKLRS